MISDARQQKILAEAHVLAMNVMAERVVAAEAGLKRLRELVTAVLDGALETSNGKVEVSEESLAAIEFSVAYGGVAITHGRHCTCSACAREDWTNADLAPCGMHGSDCPALYDPWGPAGSYV